MPALRPMTDKRRKETAPPTAQKPKRASDPPTKQKSSILDKLDRPFVRGVVVAALVAVLSYVGWNVRQHLLERQAQTKERVARAETTQREAANAVGRLITASAAIVAAHEKGFDKKQLNGTIDEYNQLQDEWDKGVAVLEADLQRDFPAQHIQAKWDQVLDHLGTLDDRVAKLDQFLTTDESVGHKQQITLCRETIADAEAGLTELTALMSTYIASIGT